MVAIVPRHRTCLSVRCDRRAGGGVVITLWGEVLDRTGRSKLSLSGRVRQTPDASVTVSFVLRALSRRRDPCPDRTHADS